VPDWHGTLLQCIRPGCSQPAGAVFCTHKIICATHQSSAVKARWHLCISWWCKTSLPGWLMMIHCAKRKSDVSYQCKQGAGAFTWCSCFNSHVILLIMFDTGCPTLVFPACLYSLLVPPRSDSGVAPPKRMGMPWQHAGKRLALCCGIWTKMDDKNGQAT
jgi:hypothetical protein